MHFNQFTVMKKNLVFPVSPQSDLWTKLTAKQQAEVAAVFRHMKKAAQIQLCYILMEYIDDAVVPEFQDDELLLSAAFVYLTSYKMPDKAPWRILPGQGVGCKEEGVRKSQSLNSKLSTLNPRKLKDIINDIFPSFNSNYK